LAGLPTPGRHRPHGNVQSARALSVRCRRPSVGPGVV
jgi:hypothetical protein